MRFLQPHSTPLVDELTLFSPKMTFAHLSWHYRCRPNVGIFISLILHNSNICHLRWWRSSQGKQILQPTFHWSIPPFSNWSTWLFTQTCWCVFTQLCQCHLEVERAKRLSSLYFGHFFSLKNFNHITKDARIFHLKLGGNHRFKYLSTSTPLGHTSHHHDRPIVGRWFLTWRKMVDLVHVVDYGHGNILTSILNQLDIL